MNSILPLHMLASNKWCLVLLPTAPVMHHYYFEDYSKHQLYLEVYKLWTF